MTEVPASFGKYYLTDKLAAGGMAEIYLGKLVGPGGFEKPLVIKQIHPRLSGQRHFVDLFVAEAKTLVSLVHGNIVPVYEFGVIGDTYFIAMEYIDGPSLFRLTEQLRSHGAQMAPALAAYVATKILDGLDYAHRKGEGIIHRDLSGRNVMVSRDGKVKLVDFGIAVALGDSGDHLGETPAGSFPYMSPEQVRREALSGQSDLFSAGILLWEMLAGERLFARDDAAATLRAVTDAPIVPPSEFNPAVPGRLDDVVLKALRRDRAERWQSAAEMLAALHRYLYSLEATPGPREFSQLVAHHCPPSGRRFRTESDATAAVADRGLASTEVPSTAVIPRPPAVPQRSFATNLELAELLEPRPADSEPSTAVAEAKVGDRDGDGDAEDAMSPGSAESTQPSAARARPPAPTDATAAPTPRPSWAPEASEVSEASEISEVSEASAAPQRPRRPRAPSAARPSAAFPRRRIALLSGALLAAVFAVATLWPTQRSPTIAGEPRADSGAPADGAQRRHDADDHDAADDAERPDAAPPPTLSVASNDAGPRDARRPPVIAPARDAGAVDSPAARPRDAGARPRDASDRGVGLPAKPRRDAAPGVPAGEPATIKVGANPWGEVFLDGKPAGRTPTTLTVTAGRHEVEVSFPVVNPPRRETYRLDLGAGETRSVLADFTQ